ncbi:AI-2E family transporter [Phreatobacter stygius]|nr:AI-2E family transporter [Phreatobacter stygius]
MAWDNFLSALASYDPPTDDTDEHAIDDGGTFEHDLVLRYAAVGIFVILAIATLNMTRAISLPVTAGVIIGLVLGPLVDRLVRHGVPRHLAAAVLVLASVGLTLAALSLLTVPIAAWSDQLPAMMAALQAKLADIFAIIKQVETALESLSTSSGLQVNVAGGSQVMHFAISSSAAAGGVLIFIATTYFYLATRRIMKARILRLCLGRGARKSAGGFFEEIEERVAAYLGIVTVINLGLGAATTIIAWIAGLPFPIFWGALAFLLNYLAFVGPIIVAALLFAAGLLTTTTTLAALWPAAAFYVLHLVESNAVTPAVVGNRLTVSPFLVFISFIFWLWLWGPIGAVLSTPILLIAMVGVETFAKYRAEERCPPAAPTP